MCLADVGLVLRVDEPSATALVELGGRQVSVSLAPLVLTGVTTTAGDWMVVHTGLAVELLDSDEAGRIRAARRNVPGRRRYMTVADPGVPRFRRPAPRTGPVNRRGVGFALAAAVVSGFSVWLNGQVVTRVDLFGDPGTYTTAKNLVAGAVIVFLAMAGTFSGGSLGLVRPTRRTQWIGLATVAVVGGAIPFLLFFEGLAASGSPADAQLVHKAGLLAFVAILGPTVLRERLGGLTLLGVGVILVGYWILSPALGSITLGTGLLLVLAASLCWASEAIIDRWLLADLSPSTLAVARMAAGSLVLLAIGLFNGDSARLADIPTAAWGWVLLTGVVLAGYAMLWLYALANAQAVDVTAALTIAVAITAAIRLAVDGIAIPSPLGVGVVAVGGSLAALAASRRPSSTVQWGT